MTEFGYFLSCEDFRPAQLLRQAEQAEQAGFRSLWISDHFHPWIGRQGNSPFVWGVIGALSRTSRLPVETAVTCPTVRVHPAVIAQAAATSAVLLEGRFRLGLGSGEALNEHILGGSWPAADVRLEMLEEAVAVIRLLLTGEEVSHRGRHYTVENARLYTLPEIPPPIDISAFGPEATALAARIGDGLITMAPDAGAVRRFRGTDGSRPAYGGLKVCWGRDRAEAVRTAHRLWPSMRLPGELQQVLPTPTHFEQAAELVTEDMVAGAVPCGPDPEEHARHLQAYVDAGFDRVHVSQIGSEQQGFFDFYRDSVLPLVTRDSRDVPDARVTR